MAKNKKNFFVKPRFRKIPQFEEVETENNCDSEVREIIVEHKSGFNTLEVLLIILVSIAFGVVIGITISVVRQDYKGEEVSKPVQELLTTYHNILDTYYKDLDENELVDAAISGMLTSLNDPHSNYFNKEEASSFNETVDGHYVGIGVTVGMKDNKAFVILKVEPNSPAKKADLKEGDIILKIGKKDISGLTLREVSSMIKDESKEKLEFTLLRDGKEIKKNVKPGIIELVSVKSEIISEEVSIGYIYIQSFAANTYDQFKKELKELENKKIKSLIIDVRDNPGGHLSQTRDILELFMKKNKVLYQVEFKGDTTKIMDETKEFRSYPVVVLIDSSSASAAEILAAAFKESYSNVTLVGETTYGKGTVQTAYSLSDGSTLKYTTEKWLTPKGNWLDGRGIVPDEEIFLTTDYLENPVLSNDCQLQKAIEILKNKSTSN